MVSGHSRKRIMRNRPTLHWTSFISGTTYLRPPPTHKPKITNYKKACFVLATKGVDEIKPDTPYSENLRDFARRCLQLDPSARSTAAELLEVWRFPLADSPPHCWPSSLTTCFLQHPFIKSIDGREAQKDAATHLLERAKEVVEGREHGWDRQHDTYGAYY